MTGDELDDALRPSALEAARDEHNSPPPARLTPEREAELAALDPWHDPARRVDPPPF